MTSMHGFGINTVFLHFHTVKLVYVIGFAHIGEFFCFKSRTNPAVYLTVIFFAGGLGNLEFPVFFI